MHPPSLPAFALQRYEQKPSRATYLHFFKIQQCQLIKFLPHFAEPIQKIRIFAPLFEKRKNTKNGRKQ